jgi:hypothetical protein
MVLFYDDFEDGTTNKWTVTNPPCIVSNLKPYSGKYGITFTTIFGGGQNPSVRMDTGINEYALPVYERAYFYLTDLSPGGTYSSLLDFADHNNFLYGHALAYMGGDGKRHFQLYSPVDGNQIDSLVIIDLNKWYCVELALLPTGNRMWINGVLTSHDVDNLTTRSGTIRFFGMGSTNYNDANMTAYGDCYALSQSYIGPIAKATKVIGCGI